MTKNNLMQQYHNINIYDIITKSRFKNIFEIIKINKIFLNIGFKNANSDKKKLINLLILLKLITNQQPIVTKSTKNDIFLKIKKNSIIGCKVVLKKKNIFFFLEQLLISNYVNSTIKINEMKEINFQFSNNNILKLINLKTEFFKFQNIPSIDISMHTNNTNIQLIKILLSSFLIFKKKQK